MWIILKRSETRQSQGSSLQNHRCHVGNIEGFIFFSSFTFKVKISKASTLINVPTRLPTMKYSLELYKIELIFGREKEKSFQAGEPSEQNMLHVNSMKQKKNPPEVAAS
ncbi:hypothetical protein PTKIN_Ptkin06aG0104500 [Pterospermum kingtungense]